jgi:hypothetical protein
VLAVARVAALPRPGAKNPLEPERVVEVNLAGTIGILVSPGGTVTLTDVSRSLPEPMLG